MDDLDLLIDLHRDAARQGPGSEAATRQALALSGLAPDRDLRVADICCGTGTTALLLVRVLGARITAVDLLPAFLEELCTAASATGLDDRIETVAADMADLPFHEGTFDAIWSEGAIYNIGFARGIAAWSPFLKPGGILAVSELTWLTTARPAELQAHWDAEYPEVDTASAKIAVIERAELVPMGYFPLSADCWLENYYAPMAARFDAFLARHRDSDAARAIVAAERTEIDLYRRNAAFVSYGFYIARKPHAPHPNGATPGATG